MSVRNEEEGDSVSAKKKVDLSEEHDWAPRRNGNRFDHKQTVAYLGHWAALGEPPIECRAYGPVQRTWILECADRLSVGW